MRFSVILVVAMAIAIDGSLARTKLSRDERKELRKQLRKDIWDLLGNEASLKTPRGLKIFQTIKEHLLNSETCNTDDLEAQISTLQGEVSAKNEEIATLEDVVAAKDVEIATLQNSETCNTDDLEAQISTLQGEVNAKDEEIAGLDSELNTCLASQSPPTCTGCTCQLGEVGYQCAADPCTAPSTVGPPPI
ncbi:unnamed protein product [Owenia fusiformis]|uniref:Uncharacterized protein n=1 Tax=Owenia fusiformis TaxID=6347 RepID=A0A8S4N4S3_OWEFU|nr:unnamed protein product [Owenia fusiformis]